MVVGAFHIEGIRKKAISLSDEEFNLLKPQSRNKKTLMPYSYYKLSTYSNYGAGNKAPGYYELLWKA